MAGPASKRASWPVSTKTPEPTTEPKPRKARSTQDRHRRSGFSLCASSVPASTVSDDRLDTRFRKRGKVEASALPYVRQLRNDGSGKKSALLQRQYRRAGGSDPLSAAAAIAICVVALRRSLLGASC
jgi:hypothetical protein